MPGHKALCYCFRDTMEILMLVLPYVAKDGLTRVDLVSSECNVLWFQEPVERQVTVVLDDPVFTSTRHLNTHLSKIAPRCRDVVLTVMTYVSSRRADVAIAALSRFPTIRKITLSNIGVLIDLEPLSRSATLQKLELDMVSGGVDSITKLPQLRALDLRCGVYDLRGIHKGLTALTHIGFFTYIADDGLEDVLKIQGLRSLVLDDCWADQPVNTWPPILGGLQSLTSLQFTDCILESEGDVFSTLGLMTLTRLERLCIDRAFVTTDVCKELMALCPALRCIQDKQGNNLM